MAVQRAVMRQKRSDTRGHTADLAGRPLLFQSAPVVAYVTAVLAYDAALIAWGVARTPLSASDMLRFIGLLTCGAICIEATRRLGRSASVPGDLLAVWWLPIVLLLPPVYALIGPIPLGALLQLRVSRDVTYRRVFSMAALGLSGAAASVVYSHASTRTGSLRNVAVWFYHPGAFARPAWQVSILLAIGCAALFGVLNAALMAAGRALQARARRHVVLWDPESLILHLAGVCVGLLVTIACALSPVLLFVALPPVILLQRSLLHQQLKVAARTDGKTGLLNMAAWQREADTEASRARRGGTPLALLLIDIDHFKDVNDTHGHLSGDQVLATLGNVLSMRARACDVAGRFGGEEFVVLLPGANEADACQAAERLREQISSAPLAFAAGEVTVTVSVGVAVLGAHGNDIPELLASADVALYRAKEAGRNQVCLFDAHDNTTRT